MHTNTNTHTHAHTHRAVDVAYVTLHFVLHKLGLPWCREPSSYDSLVQQKALTGNQACTVR